MIIIEDCLRFTIADLKRLGCFVPNSVVSGTLSWNNTTASITIKVDNIKKIVSLDYIVDGERHMNYNVYIYEQEANIGKGVVRFFNCPKTHNLCRKLYLCGDMFVSRKAMRGAMYRNQTKSKWERALYNGCLREDFIPYKRYGKQYYRGKITPYGKRIERYQNIVERGEAMLFDWLLRDNKISRVVKRFRT